MKQREDEVFPVRSAVVPCETASEKHNPADLIEAHFPLRRQPVCLVRRMGAQ